MQLGPCCARVADLCEAAHARLGPEAGAEALALRSRLGEPLRVAVAGRVKSGKSTLVNALLGHRVAATAVGECTRTVTWYRNGYPPVAHRVHRDGRHERLPLTAGQRLPEALGADPGELDRVEVQLSSAALEHLTVIDTPGLASTRDELSAATRRTLAVGPASRAGDEDELSRRTEDAASRADALLYLVSGTVHRDETQVLEAFRSSLGPGGASAANTLVVLGRADLLGEEGEDPLAAAARLARGYAARLAPLAATVVPTVGLVAETLEAGLFTEDDAAVIRALAELGPEGRELLLGDVVSLLEIDVEVPREARARLLERLGLYALRRSVEWAGEGRGSAGELRAALAALTGLAELRRLVDDVFVRRSDVLKAASALMHLEHLAQALVHDGSTEAPWLAREVERLRLDPAMRGLATAWALAQIATRRIELPRELEASLRRVALGGDLHEMLGVDRGGGWSELERAAAEGSARWRELASFGARSDERRLAHLLCQQYAALWQLASEQRAARA